MVLIFQDWFDLAILCGLLARRVARDVKRIRERDGIVTALVENLKGVQQTCREGAMTQVSGRELVPGDIVHVEEGQTLLGEALMVSVEGDVRAELLGSDGGKLIQRWGIGDVCHSGGKVIQGKAIFIVCSTGHHQSLGRYIDRMGDPVPPHARPQCVNPAPRQAQEYHKTLRSVGYVVGTLIIVIVSVIWKLSGPLEASYLVLNFSLACIILVTPTFAHVTAIMQEYGMKRLLDADALVLTGSTPTSVECLADVDVLCAERSGTLMDTLLVMQEPYCVSGKVDDLIMTADLSCEPNYRDRNWGGKAIYRTLQLDPKKRESLKQHEILGYQEPQHTCRLTWAWVRSPDGRQFGCTSGSLDDVLSVCEMDGRLVKKYLRKSIKLVHQGRECCGVARKSPNGKGTFLGILSFISPPRETAYKTIDLASFLGITVKMMAGEDVISTQAYARRLDGRTNIVSANLCHRTDKNKLISAELSAKIAAADGYADICGGVKEELITHLQRHGHRVAMEGNWLRDTRALRKADCGIAGKGTQEMVYFSSNLLMVDAGLDPMFRAFLISRQSFWRVWTYITYRFTISLHLIFVLVGCFAVYHDVPNLNLLLFNTHFSDIIGILMARETRSTVITRKPTRWSIWRLWITIVPLVIILTLGTGLTTWALTTGEDTVEASVKRQQVIFLHVILSDHWPFLISRIITRLFRLQIRDWRAGLTIPILGLVATLSCVLGWVNDSARISPAVAMSVWLCSFATACTAAVLRCFILNGKLMIWDSWDTYGGVAYRDSFHL